MVFFDVHNKWKKSILSCLYNNNIENSQVKHRKCTDGNIRSLQSNYYVIEDGPGRKQEARQEKCHQRRHSGGERAAAAFEEKKGSKKNLIINDYLT